MQMPMYQWSQTCVTGADIDQAMSLGILTHNTYHCLAILIMSSEHIEVTNFWNLLQHYSLNLCPSVTSLFHTHWCLSFSYCLLAFIESSIFLTTKQQTHKVSAQCRAAGGTTFMWPNQHSNLLASLTVLGVSGLWWKSRWLVHKEVDYFQRSWRQSFSGELKW